jgi:hypothetical protein
VSASKSRASAVASAATPCLGTDKVKVKRLSCLPSSEKSNTSKLTSGAPPACHVGKAKQPSLAQPLILVLCTAAVDTQLWFGLRALFKYLQEKRV